MLIELNKEDIIYLLKGADVGSYALAELYIKRGYGTMGGNQHNERWDWNISVLKQLTENTLWTLYLENKPKRLY